MLDLEVIPERALGGRQWEFVLGENFKRSLSGFFVQTGRVSCPTNRYATGSGGGDTQETVRRYQERTDKV